jgi:hypothetical protein
MRMRWVTAVAVVSIVGCSGGGDDELGGEGDGGDADADTDGNNLFGNPDPDELTIFDGAVYDPDAGCGESLLEPIILVTEDEIVITEEVTEVEPVALYLMLDQSASMQAGFLWDPAKTAVKEFVDDPSSAGIDLALDYFPSFLGEAGECNGAGFNAPAVEAGRLPAHAPNIHASLDALPLALGLGTPIEGALNGAVSYCEAFQAANPDEKCVAVLVTDGYPEILCSNDYGVIVDIAANAHAKGVTTFAVGLAGADFFLLDMIAEAGGATDCSADPARFACDVSGGASQLVDVLKKIRDSVTTTNMYTETTTMTEEIPLACEWGLPVSNQLRYDKRLVNVELSAPSGEVIFGRVDDPSTCAVRGWYYDNFDAPTRVIACPQTCELITSTPQAKIDIVVGCKPLPLQ